jgi:hypothetical protein
MKMPKMLNRREVLESPEEEERGRTVFLLVSEHGHRKEVSACLGNGVRRA